MGFPSKLKDMGLYLDGNDHRGEAAEVTVPKLMIKFEDWRGGGMLGPVPIDMGLDKLELEFTIGGLIASALRSFGAATHNAGLVRFAGAYQDDTTGEVQAVEIVVLGRYAEVDFGNAKPGDDTQHKYKMACSYYKLTVDGVDWIEIDLVAGIFKVFGIDRRAEIRAAIGA